MLKAIRCREAGAFLLAAPLVLLGAGNAAASLLGDTIKPFVQVSETYDSNVFRVRDRDQLKALVGDDRMGDFINVTTVGSAFHYGLSQLESNLLLKRDFIDYSHYGSLSGSRDEMSGDVSVGILNQVRVKLDGGYLREPEARTDFRFPESNDMTTIQYGLLVGYEAKSGLGLEAGYRRIGVDYSLRQFQENEYDLDRYLATLSYRLSTDAKVYAAYQRENRDYRVGMQVGDATVPRGNTGDSVRVGVEKSFSPKTAVSGYVGYQTRRNSSGLAARDFSGMVGKGEIRYGLTSKVGVVVNGERQLYEETYRDQPYSVNTSVGAGVVYQATEKVKATVINRLSWKDFRSVPGSGAPNRSDLTREVNAGIEWNPRDRISVTVGYQYANRSSKDSSFNYASHAVTAGVGYKF